MRKKYPGVSSTKKPLRDGSIRTHFYYRANNTKLTAVYGSPEFDQQYEAAKRGVTREDAAPKLPGLIRRYIDSVEFNKNLAESTQREYRRMLTKVEAKFYNMPIAALEDRRVRKDFLDWRDANAVGKTGREADYRLSALSAMLTWAENRSIITINHLRNFKRIHHADRAEIIWLPEHIEKFCEVAPLEMRRAMFLALHTGQRQGDLLRLEWPAYDGKTIWLRQSKRARKGSTAPLVGIPCTEALQNMLNGMDKTTVRILTTKTGKPFGKRYFAHLWSQSARAAGVDRVRLPGVVKPERLHFHDIRGTTITLLSEAESTPQEIATITGHTLAEVARILDHYVARTQGLAKRAIERWEKSPATAFANRLQTSKPAKGG